jgi:hypothetical protein
MAPAAMLASVIIMAVIEPPAPAMADLHGIWWMRGVLILTSTGMSRARLLMVLSNGGIGHPQVVDSLRRPNGEGCQNLSHESQ